MKHGREEEEGEGDGEGRRKKEERRQNVHVCASASAMLPFPIWPHYSASLAFTELYDCTQEIGKIEANMEYALENLNLKK